MRSSVRVKTVKSSRVYLFASSTLQFTSKFSSSEIVFSLSAENEVYDTLSVNLFYEISILRHDDEQRKSVLARKRLFFVTNFQIAAFSSPPNEISMKPEAFDVRRDAIGKQ